MYTAVVRLHRDDLGLIRFLEMFHGTDLKNGPVRILHRLGKGNLEAFFRPEELTFILLMWNI
jgi:hypothetical protein